MKAIILNYPTESVEVVLIPEGIAKEWSAQPESAYYQTNLEEYLACELGYSLDNINYMVSAENVPVYDGTTPIGNQEPLLYL